MASKKKSKANNKGAAESKKTMPFTKKGKDDSKQPAKNGKQTGKRSKHQIPNGKQTADKGKPEPQGEQMSPFAQQQMDMQAQKDAELEQRMQQMPYGSYPGEEMQGQPSAEEQLPPEVQNLSPEEMLQLRDRIKDKVYSEPEGDAVSDDALNDRERGRHGIIGEDEVSEAYEIFSKYKQGKQNLDTRIVEEEQWYKQRHWENIIGSETKEGMPEPTSAWMFNSLANKHADFMDNYPTANVLPRAKDDKEDAHTLEQIIPTVFDRNEFKKVYSDNSWYKLKHGGTFYGVFWNSAKDNGLGDIDIVTADVLNLFWQPGVKDIQKSPNLFYLSLENNDVLEESYPWLKDKLGGDTYETKKYITDDHIDTTDMSVVFDWYYKKTINGRNTVHLCKFCNGEVLYASENDPVYRDKGFYDHGKFPYVADVMFPVEGSAVGFGYISIMKDPQLQIDKLDQMILMNAHMTAQPRYFASDNLNLNISDFTDFEKTIVKVSGQIDDTKLKQIDVQQMPGFVNDYLLQKIDELKETSGNRDFSQGSTQSGVTAASAIAALQEAGSKLSRDMIQTSYQCYEQISYMVLELIRQFYNEPREFRITGKESREDFIIYDNTNIREQQISPEDTRKPVFDLRIVAQKQSPFQRISQNELIKELFGMGLFAPENADQAITVIEHMEFEDKDSIVEDIKKNGTMVQMIQQLQQALQQIAGQMDMVSGGTTTAALMQAGLIPANDQLMMAAQQQQQAGQMQGQQGQGQNMDQAQGNTDTDNSQATQARQRVASSTVVGGR